MQSFLSEFYQIYQYRSHLAMFQTHYIGLNSSSLTIISQDSTVFFTRLAIPYPYMYLLRLA